MGRKKAIKTVQQMKPDDREFCPCPVCKKRAMDILGGESVEIKCPHCNNFVPIPLDKEKRALIVAEDKPAKTS